MRKIKRTISFITALIITALPLSAELSPLTGNSEEYVSVESTYPSWFEGVTEDGFRYEAHTMPERVSYILSYEGTEPDVVFPKEIKGYEDFDIWSVAPRLFADNQTIKNVDLSDCRNISDGFFENSSVETVILPKSLSYIPSDLFKNCKNLKHVEFGKNVEIIPESAFEGTNYVLPDNMAAKVRKTYYDNYELCVVMDDWTYTPWGKEAQMWKYNGNDTDIVIPEKIDNRTVTMINSGIFMSDEPKTVNSIVLPKTLESFNGLELKNPERLKHITFKSDEIHLNSVKMSDYGVEEMTFPLLNTSYVDNEHVVGNGFYKDAEHIKKVHFDNGEGKLKLESGVFVNCPALDTVTFSGYDTVDVGKGAFENCPALDTVTFSGNDTVVVGKGAFDNTSLRRLEFNTGCRFTTDMFKDCDNLQEIVFNGNVSSTSGVFKDIPLNNVIFADDSISVSVGAFDSCRTLMNVNSEPAFDSSTGEFNEKNKDLIIKYFGGADDVGFVNEYVMWHVKDIVAKYTNDSMSDMEKAKVLHDWVCENVSYSPKTYAAAEDHNDLSPFLTGVTVCDGYARAYNLLLHEAGIETCQVNSSNHIWNIIKIGGHYFHVDTTWDDGTKNKDDWFLKSDNEIKAETSSHNSWELKTTSSLHSFQSSVMPECTYSMGDCNTDGSISVADAVKMNRYIMGADAVDSDDLVLYDLDFSGSVDVFDMVEMRKTITEVTGLGDIYSMKQWLLGGDGQISAEFDMNGDGVVDVFDMILLRQNLS